MNENFLILEGYTNDLLMVNNNASMKSTRLVQLDSRNIGEIDEEIIDIAITSTNMNGEHEMFDKLLGKKIRITVEVFD